MRSIQLGIAIAAGLCSLLLATLWVSAQTIPPDPAASEAETPVLAAQTAPLVLTATVGLDPGVCTSNSTVQPRANQLVYYCFTISNTSGAVLTNHQISSTLRSITTSLVLAIPPNTITNTMFHGLVFTDVTNADVTNTITWTARSANSATVVTATDQVAINVVGPAVSIVKTVGQDSATCSSATRLPTPLNQLIYYCLTLINTGDVALTRHTVSDPLLGINNVTFDHLLAPDEELTILHNTPAIPFAGRLAKSSGTVSTTNTVTVTSVTTNGLQVSAVATARVEVGSTTVQFAKTVGTDPHACPPTTTVTVQSGTHLYYCVTIRNTGIATLTRHALVEQPLSIDLRLNYTLAPGSVLTVTNDFLIANNEPVVFGPFEFSNRFPRVVNNIMTYTGTAPGGFQVVANGSTSANFSTPTPTRPPERPATSTPFPTSTPTNTPLPPTATETPTPTFTPVTPTPTETRSYAISLLETPTPSQPQPFPTPIVDPAFLPLTLTAEAATATAAAPPPFSPLETPTPDPFFFTPTPAIFSPLETPTPFPTPPPLLPTAVDTPTEAALVVVVTNTPQPEAGQWPPGQRPVVPPTATPTPDYVMFAATMIDSFLLSAGWIWFLAGSLFFFVSAGVVAGLFFRRQEQRRFDLVEGDLEDGALAAPPTPPAARDARAGTEPDDWPDNLP